MIPEVDKRIKARDKCGKLARDIGADIDRLADAIWRKIKSEVDPANL